VSASTREIYGDDVQLPDGASIVYQGVDPHAGAITKYYTVDRHILQGSADR
jgi:hypothetical protein